MAESTAFHEISQEPVVPAEMQRYLMSVREGTLGPNGYVILLGMRAMETPSLLKSVENGFLFSAFVHFVRNIALSAKVVASLIQVPARTLDRRREQGRLEPVESDRLLRVTRAFAAALELFEGDLEAARHWMSRPQRALGGERPLNLLTTELGTREVESLIGRLEHGAFS